MSELAKLYIELSKLKWMGADDGWDEAISAVRLHIVKNLSKEDREELADYLHEQ